MSTQEKNNLPSYPPPPTYSGYQPSPGNAPLPGPHPTTLNGMLQVFAQDAQLVLTKPSTASFDAVEPNANWNTILAALGIAAIASGILTAISSAYTNLNVLGIGRATHDVYAPVSTFLSNAIGTFAAFFLATGMLYLIARAFGGTGSYLSSVYALALIGIPITIVDAMFGLIPVLGGLASLALGIYVIYLAILATSAVHKLPMSSAIWVVLLPAFIGILLAIFAIVVIGSIVFAILHAK